MAPHKLHPYNLHIVSGQVKHSSDQNRQVIDAIKVEGIKAIIRDTHSVSFPRQSSGLRDGGHGLIEGPHGLFGGHRSFGVGRMGTGHMHARHTNSYLVADTSSRLSLALGP